MNSKIKGLRQAKGISQDRLARMTDVTRGTIGTVERGKKKPNVYLALKIAHVLGATVEQLWGDD